MFKAINKQNNEEIIILHPRWASSIGHLRSLDRKDVLVCPGCKQPVRVWAGQVKRKHFAHKHLQDCPLQYEPLEVLEARALLYEWLIGKFDEAVSLEKKVEGDFLSRPVDCWVETKSESIAYWLIRSLIKPQQREALKCGFEQMKVKANWVFLTNMLREDEQRADWVHLTTTEREFMLPSDYDQIERGFQDDPGRSLHYLDPENETLTTFRNLHLIHRPQLYAGRKEKHHLSEMLPLAKTGEFVHPGEHERLQVWKAEEKQWLAERERAAYGAGGAGGVPSSPLATRTNETNGFHSRL